MSRFLAALAEIVAALASLVLGTFRLFVGLIRPPPSEAGALDEAAAAVQEAQVAVERGPEIDTADIARRFLAGHDDDRVCSLPRRQQVWLRIARAQGVDVSGMTNDMLESYVNGRWRQRGWAPLVDERVVREVEADLAGTEPEVLAYA